MKVWKITATCISAYLWLAYIASPAYCESVRGQQNQVLSRALEISITISPLPQEIIDLALYLANAQPIQYESLTRLFRALHDSAEHAESAEDYARANSAAVYVLKALNGIDPNLALRLFQSWPDRQGFEQYYTDFSKQFEAAKQQNRLANNPMDYLNERIPIENTNAWMAVIWRLQSTKPIEARAAFERLLNEGEKQRGSFASTPIVVGKILKPNLWDGSLFSRYFGLLKRSPFNMNYELSCDNRSTALNYAEGEAFQVIMWSVTGDNLEMAAEMLQAVPVLKQKVDEVGGLEAIWDRGALRGKSPYVGSPVLFKGNKDLNARLINLCELFNYDPEEGHKSLEIMKAEKNFEFVSRAVSAPCPAMSGMASSIAREMVLNESDAENRISMALKLLPRYSDSTSLGSEWIDFGFKVLRGAEPRTSFPNRAEFEDTLIGQLSLVDFGRAMSYIDTTDDPLSRLQMLIAVIGALDRQLMKEKQ